MNGERLGDLVGGLALLEGFEDSLGLDLEGVFFLGRVGRSCARPGPSEGVGVQLGRAQISGPTTRLTTDPNYLAGQRA